MDQIVPAEDSESRSVMTPTADRSRADQRSWCHRRSTPTVTTRKRITTVRRRESAVVPNESMLAKLGER
jgi:hypothetical protein